MAARASFECQKGFYLYSKSQYNLESITDLNFSLTIHFKKYVVGTVIAVTNELSEVTKRAFTYDNPIEEMGNNYILIK